MSNEKSLLSFDLYIFNIIQEANDKYQRISKDWQRQIKSFFVKKIDFLLTLLFSHWFVCLNFVRRYKINIIGTVWTVCKLWPQITKCSVCNKSWKMSQFLLSQPFTSYQGVLDFSFAIKSSCWLTWLLINPTYVNIKNLKKHSRVFCNI